MYVARKFICFLSLLAGLSKLHPPGCGYGPPPRIGTAALHLDKRGSLICQKLAHVLPYVSFIHQYSSSFASVRLHQSFFSFFVAAGIPAVFMMNMFAKASGTPCVTPLSKFAQSVPLNYQDGCPMAQCFDMTCSLLVSF